MLERLLTPSGRGFRDDVGGHYVDAEYQARFSVEETCRDYLFVHRWPDGWSCRRCGGTLYRWLDSKRLRCLRCHKRASLTAGTILHGTRKPLTLWFRAAFLVVQWGANARTLQRELHLTYKIAWVWAHKLRWVMKGMKRTLDAPVPPFDLESCLGQGRNPNVVARAWFARNGHFQWEAERPDGLGTCCARLTKADWGLPPSEEKARHTSYSKVPAIVFAEPRLFRAYSGSLSDKHLETYLVETEFRFNHRNLRPAVAAETLLGRLVLTEPHPYRSITGRPPERPSLWFSGPSLLAVPLGIPATAQPAREGG